MISQGLNLNNNNRFPKTGSPDIIPGGKTNDRTRKYSKTCLSGTRYKSSRASKHVRCFYACSKQMEYNKYTENGRNGFRVNFRKQSTEKTPYKYKQLLSINDRNRKFSTKEQRLKNKFYKSLYSIEIILYNILMSRNISINSACGVSFTDASHGELTLSNKIGGINK